MASKGARGKELLLPEKQEGRDKLEYRNIIRERARDTYKLESIDEWISQNMKRV